MRLLEHIPGHISGINTSAESYNNVISIRKVKSLHYVSIVFINMQGNVIGIPFKWV